MKIKNKIILLMMLAAFQFANVSPANAAAIDDELAIIAAEQEKSSEENLSSESEVQTPKLAENLSEKPAEKSRKELKAEKKRLAEERKAAEKKLKEERKQAKKKSSSKEEKKSSPEETKKPEPVTPIEPEIKPEPPEQNSPVEIEQKTSEGIANPVVNYSNFEELAKAVNFTPLYIPKKSGYAMNMMMAIDGKVAEIRYGRRWEPQVSLSVRTYKRADGEELKDISGVFGVKWRIDMTSGTTIYIAKIDETTHVAAWAAGNYTFSAHVTHLSFAAFHSLVADELVDLSTHYYMNFETE